MMIHGTPLTSISVDGSSEPRFYYWFGASGRRYIHSIYPVDCVPPLPGAVFVAVRRIGSLRTALSVGRFGVFWDLTSAPDRGGDADELHVHLLAQDDGDAQAIANDLSEALAKASLTLMERAPARLPAFPANDRGCPARADARRC